MSDNVTATLDAAIGLLTAMLNQQQEVARATADLLKRLEAKKATGQEWSDQDKQEYFAALRMRDDQVAASTGDANQG